MTYSETIFWQNILVAYVSGGHSLDEGASYEFADRTLEALRKRQSGEPVEPSKVSQELKTQQKLGERLKDLISWQGMTPTDAARVVLASVNRYPEQKIMAIKDVREALGLGSWVEGGGRHGMGYEGVMRVCNA
jgi:hypothetical protein